MDIFNIALIIMVYSNVCPLPLDYKLFENRGYIVFFWFISPEPPAML